MGSTSWERKSSKNLYREKNARSSSCTSCLRNFTRPRAGVHGRLKIKSFCLRDLLQVHGLQDVISITNRVQKLSALARTLCSLTIVHMKLSAAPDLCCQR